MHRTLPSAVVLAATLLLRPATAAAEVDYVRDIKPILRARCYPCHGALRQKSKLRLDTTAFMRQGGRRGPAVVPGKSSESVLLDAVTSHDMPRMPPEAEGKPLTDAQIASLKQWIDQGAKAADEPVPEDPRKHWAFQRPVRSAVPHVNNGSWVRNPIDAFITAEHGKHGVQASPPAAKETLLRRVYLDLIGLPPTRQELHAFLADGADDAFEKVVDRLLASPQYGERWARHWMDVWRYSDWYGRRGVPDVWNSAPQIWRWRDWIVTSLNSDKGYDRMIREMLAGDEISALDEDTVVATGYIVRNWYALNYNQWMRDLVEHTGKAFLGLTFNCCHCHDHKYDPLSQEDYFRFRAFFEPLELRQDRLPGEPDPGPFQKYEYSVLRKVVQSGAIRVFDEKLKAKTFMYRGGDERNRMEGKAPLSPGVPEFLGGDRLNIAPVELPAAAYYPGLQTFVQKEELARREQAILAARKVGGVHAATAEADLAAVKARIAADNAKYGNSAGNRDDLARAASKAEHLFALCAAKETLNRAEQTLAEVRRKGASATTGKSKDQASAPIKKAEQQLATAKKSVESAEKALATPSTKYTPLSPLYPARSTGRRRALAEWIANRQNPLTARVAVNHIWMRHFGLPLVASVYDFGRNGKRPSHPELLDWLAVDFMDSGWSVKHLHRLIVTSNAYRMQSKPSTAAATNLDRDHDNRWVWHFPPRRLEAEAVRDSVLAVSGELDAHVGGQVLENTLEGKSQRRSLYFAVYPEGGGHLKMLSTFDAPDPCDCYRRSESIVPQQALLMTNSQLMLDASRLLARRLCTEIVSEEAFVVAAFEQLLARKPSTDELTACIDFLHRQRNIFSAVSRPSTKGEGTIAPSSDATARARESLLRALFSHDEFVTLH
jgi:hypothetical protein